MKLPRYTVYVFSRYVLLPKEIDGPVVKVHYVKNEGVYNSKSLTITSVKPMKGNNE